MMKRWGRENPVEMKFGFFIDLGTQPLHFPVKSDLTELSAAPTRGIFVGRSNIDSTQRLEAR